MCNFMLFKDARDYQILFLSSFLILGIVTRDWTLHVGFILVLFISCLLTQALFSVAIARPNHENGQSLPPYFYFVNYITSWRSATITSLGLSLLLRGNHWQTMAIAGCLAIASKFLFRYRGKHFFNPANFGIIAALILTHDAWVSPGQWGNDWWYLILFVGAGGIVLKRVGRLDTSATFLVTYICLEAIRNLYLGWSWDVWQHQLMSGSLLLFAFFMITDPRSIPNAAKGRIFWSICLASSTFIIQHFFYLQTALFWSLFALSPLTIICDSIWKKSQFTWQANQQRPYRFNQAFLIN
jgi:Na+-transporting NADH:ubiquinone oxidoreductase subunit NqrB